MSLLSKNGGRLCVAASLTRSWPVLSRRDVCRWSQSNHNLYKIVTPISQHRGHRLLLSSSNNTTTNLFQLQPFRLYSASEQAIDLDKLSEEIQILQDQVQQIRSRLTIDSTTTVEVEIPITDRKIGDSDEEENVYRLAYDFPGFKSKNIKVTVSDNLLKIYAFQTSSKKESAEYIYEHTNEEILPDEVQSDKVTASFDAENGFLVIEALLPETVNLEQTMKRTRERNEKLGKVLKQLEEKKKTLEKERKASKEKKSESS